MAVEHAALTGADLHESKGIASAGVDTIYAANGAGSGTHRKVTAASIDTTSIKNVNVLFLMCEITDISTPGSRFIVCPRAGVITKIWSTIDAAITVADAILSFKIAGVAVTNGNITVATAGSAPGDVDSSTPTAARTLTAGQALEVITDGGSTTVSKCTVVIEVDIT